MLSCLLARDDEPGPALSADSAKPRGAGVCVHSFQGGRMPRARRGPFLVRAACVPRCHGLRQWEAGRQRGLASRLRDWRERQACIQPFRLERIEAFNLARRHEGTHTGRIRAFVPTCRDDEPGPALSADSAKPRGATSGRREEQCLSSLTRLRYQTCRRLPDTIELHKAKDLRWDREHFVADLRHAGHSHGSPACPRTTIIKGRGQGAQAGLSIFLGRFSWAAL